MKLDWRRPLFWIALPFLIFLAFLGVPLPFPPEKARKPEQTQGCEIDPESKG